MNVFKPTAAKTPEEYIDLIDEPRKSEVKTLHEFIQRLVPDLKPHILVGMIGYGTYHYKRSLKGDTKSELTRSPYRSVSREGDWSLLALASQKNYTSVYVCATDGKEYVAEKYKAKFPKASIGKSCIRFKKIADIDLDNLKEVILEAVKLGPMNLS